MADAIPLVLKLQADALDPKVPVVSLLRMAKIIATKLDLKDALIWIDRELDGYMSLTVADLPPYRRLSGEPKGYNPYHGWQPIHFTKAEVAEVYSQAPLGQALGAMEASLEKKSSGSYQFPFDADRKARLMKSIQIPTDVTIFLSYGQLWGIIDAVRNLILNWSLELEKAGILGEGMTFTATEKRQAGPVTKQYFIQNAGTVGDISGQSSGDTILN